MAGGESRLGMRVMYMISLNHGLAQKSITILHAYKLAENPRKPAQSRAFAHKDPRKFGLENTQGRHYTPNSAPPALQLLDLTHATLRKIAKSAPKLRKLG